MTPRCLPLAAGLLVLCAPTWSRADEPPPPPRETRFFETFDKDQDGRVTQEEFTAGQGDAASFALLDRNKDGAITPDELGLPADYKPKPRPPGEPGAAGAPGGKGPGAGAPEGRGAEMRRRLKEMDKDGDGKITREEWTGLAEGFDRNDRNKDGVLDGQDFAAGGGAGMQGGGRIDPELVKARWKAMDKDGDGKVSRDEYTGEFPFERVDQDKDGFLTEADLKGFKGPGAGPTQEELERRFGELDKDASGKVEAAECPEANRERMLKADADGDGALSKEEFLRAMKRGQRREGGPGGPGVPQGPGGPGGPSGPGGPGGSPAGPELLRRFDHDHDGKVTRDQFPGTDEQFAKLDRDGDGTLTEKDFPPPAPGGPGAPPTGTGAPGAGGGPTPPPAPAMPSIPELDKDGDGRLSRAEFKGNDDDWRRLDANHDGWITSDELAPR